MLEDERGFSMAVTDNGVGLQPGDTQKANSFGLIGMKERIHALGGELLISTIPGGGTTLSIHIAMGKKRPLPNHPARRPILCNVDRLWPPPQERARFAHGHDDCPLRGAQMRQEK